MGARGKLKIASHLVPVADGIEGTAAADVPPEGPVKPADVEDDVVLSDLWDEIVPELNRAGLVARSDGPSIEIALRHFQMARQAYRQVGGDVMVSDHHNSDVKKNPAEAVFRAESEMFLKYAQQLGMTFVSRARTPGVKGEADGEPNPFQAASGS